MTREIARKHLEELVEEFFKSVDVENHFWTKEELELNFTNWIERGKILFNARI